MMEHMGGGMVENRGEGHEHARKECTWTQIYESPGL